MILQDWGVLIFGISLPPTGVKYWTKIKEKQKVNKKKLGRSPIQKHNTTTQNKIHELIWSEEVFKKVRTSHIPHILPQNGLVHSLWSVDWQPVDEPPASDQVVGREV